ncbi:unnamed protein product, partial [Musa acuminata subsp. burmannicoides]
MIYVNESNYLSFDLLENYLSRDYQNYFTKDIFVITFVHQTLEFESPKLHQGVKFSLL